MDVDMAPDPLVSNEVVLLEVGADPATAAQWESFTSLGPHKWETYALPEADAAFDCPGALEMSHQSGCCGCRGRCFDFPEAYHCGTVYVPVAAAAAAQLWPSVVLVSGYTNSADSMAGWARFFVSHGVVAVTVACYNTFTSWPASRAASLVAGVKQLRIEHVRPDSSLCGKLDVDCIGVLGFSLGGGGAQLAAMLEPGLIKTVVALCPHSGCPCNPPHFESLAHGVPVMIVSATCDPLACPCKHGRQMYETTQEGTPKLYLELSGGHEMAHGPSGGSVWSFLGPYGCCQAVFGVCCPCLCCNSCADDCATGGMGPPEEGCCAINGQEVMGQYTLGWLRVHLQGQKQFVPFLNEEPDQANDFKCSMQS